MSWYLTRLMCQQIRQSEHHTRPRVLTSRFEQTQASASLGGAWAGGSEGMGITNTVLELLSVSALRLDAVRLDASRLDVPDSV
jgi:hypothetical protein